MNNAAVQIDLSRPTVTVIVSSYNRPRLIRDALDSIVNQDGVTIEVIVADDHSNAETQRVLGQYNVCVVQPPGPPADASERQHGQRCAVAINAALPSARGKYLAFLPDDDFLLPGSLACRAKFLDEHPRARVVYGRLESCKAVGVVPRAGIHSDWGKRFVGPRESHACDHDRSSFFDSEPIARAANRVDHGMIMVRRLPHLPEWPEAPVTTPEVCDCPDAGWLLRLELRGWGPFFSVPDFVAVKRYHGFGHRTDPGQRE